MEFEEHLDHPLIQSTATGSHFLQQNLSHLQQATLSSSDNHVSTTTTALSRHDAFVATTISQQLSHDDVRSGFGNTAQGRESDLGDTTHPSVAALPIVQQRADHNNMRSESDGAVSRERPGFDDVQADPGSQADLTADDNDDSLPPIADLGERGPEMTQPPAASHIAQFQTALDFIEELKGATLENSGLDNASIKRLCNLPQGSPDVDDPDFHLSLDVYLAVSNASQQMYTAVRNAILHRDPSCGMLSYAQITRHVAELSCVILIVHDMCKNSCVAYTGPFSDLNDCPECHEPWYEKSAAGLRVPRQQFHTIPIGPGLQALRWNLESAESFNYLGRRVEEILQQFKLNPIFNVDVYDDFCIGSDILKAIQDG